MLRISLIAPTTLPSRRANTIQVMKMAQALVETGYTVHMFVPRAGGRPFREPDWQELEQHYGISTRFPIRWLPAVRWLRSYDFGFRAVQAARARRSDLIYTRHPQAAAIAASTGISTILEIHDFPQGSSGPVLFRRFLKARGAVRLVSVSDALLEDLKNHFDFPDRLPTCVAPDGVDLARYIDLPGPEKARANLGLPEGFTAGYTGHLYEGRGVDLILTLAARLSDIHFLIAGGRPEDVKAYRQKSAGLRNVQFTGFIPNADLPHYQAACDTLLMPYQRQVEASSGGDISAYLSPMKLFEYLASGRAILSSDLPVLREVLTTENAVLLPPEDPFAWQSALERLQTDPGLRAGLAAHARRTAQEYTWQARVKKILAGLG